MSRPDNFDNEDFTFDAYRQYVIAAREQYDFCFYDECFDKSQFVLWRHDIDVSMHRAAKLARIEYEEGVKATYFIWLHSYPYHFWEKEISELIYGILNQGHRIGLHFDCSYYPDLSVDNIGDIIAEEAGILEKAFHTEIGVFSLHDTSEAMLQSNRAEKIGGLINTYSDYFFRQCKYISDSNGLWRNEHLLEVLDAAVFPKLQVLIHPVWWTEEPASPLEKMIQCFDGRARKNKAFYEQARKSIMEKLQVPESGS